MGKNGRIFDLYKFRTLIIGADKMGNSTAGDDFRMTKIGRFLRKYKIDETLQIINFIKGDLTICGPRADLVSEIESLDNKTRDIILSVKPGLFNFATLWNFHEEDNLSGQKDPHKFYCDYIKPKKYELEVWYVKHKCFRLDLFIVIMSILRLLGIDKILGKVYNNNIWIKNITKLLLKKEMYRGIKVLLKKLI